MRRVSAQYVFTSAGPPLSRAVVTVDDDGTIIQVEDTGGTPGERAATEFYNGIIMPGMINCHAHLELSHMAGAVAPGGGLRSFVTSMGKQREAPVEAVIAAMEQADREMYRGGVEACADISNNILSLNVKLKSPIRYLTFAETFGLDPAIADSRMSEAAGLAGKIKAAGLPAQVTPHSLYSLSAPLSSMVNRHIRGAPVISLHFLESDEEREMTHRHVESALELALLVSHLILVHNTVITRAEAEELVGAGNIWFSLCPSSNLYITGKMPPASMLREVTERIVTGTDSLASTGRLSMIEELLLLQQEFPELTAEELIRWATINGARALMIDESLGSIEPGKRPGLLLVEEFDLQGMRFLPGSSVRRLV